MRELSNIVIALREEFSKATNRFEKRKIIIWYDYDKEFEDIIDDVKIDGVKVHKLNNNNYFYTKYLLDEEDTESNYLIYTNSIEEDKNNWILDITIYSESFYADRTSMIMRELNINDSLRQEFSKYKVFFNSEKRRGIFNSIISKVEDTRSLELGIIGALSKGKILDFEESTKSILCVGLENDNNSIYKDMAKYNILDAFWNYCRSYYGYNLEERSLNKLFTFIITTSLSSYIKEEKLIGLKRYIGSSKPNCIVFIDHWINHRTDSYIYTEYANCFEEEFDLKNIVSKIDIDDYKEVDILKIFDEEVIKYILFCLEDDREDYEYFINIIEIRKTKNFYADYKNIYEALSSYINMAKLKLEIKNEFGIKKISQFIKEYSEKLYKFDFYYRKFYLNYDERPEGRVMNQLKDLVENLYVNWYLSELLVNWNYGITDEYLNNWTIPDVLNQNKFYKSKVNKMIESGDKVFVIISDALRYEIGVELKDKFNEVVVGSSEIEPMVSVIPSITKIGMSALLPNKEISINESGRVFVDGNDSAGLENRKKILANNFGNSIAVEFNSIPKNKIEFNKLLKGYKLVYIYHNVIDAIGDKMNTEKDVFKGAEQALEDIMWLRDKITGWLGGVNIFVTADHGFLYQRSSLEEVNKIGKEKIELIDKNRRSLISKEEKDIEGLFRFKLDYLSSENKGIYAYVPKSDIRFKTQGGGSNYVHGGVSIQETIVPLIFYKHKRSTYKGYKQTKYVSLRLLNNNNKITTEEFVLTFFQVEEVSEEAISAIYEVYMIDENESIISNKEKIIANSKSKPEDRNYKVRMKLKRKTYSKRASYRLIVRNIDKDTIEEIPFIIDIAIVDDFF